MAYITSDNNYATSLFIVGPSGHANYTTIQSAITAASAGSTIYVLEGTYTENLTLKAGVSMVSSADVTIVGKCTADFAGSASISGIKLQTNGAQFLDMPGNAATILNLINCNLIVSDAVAGITAGSGGSTCALTIDNCKGDIANSGGKLFGTNGSLTTVLIKDSTITNSGNSTAACFSGPLVTILDSSLSFALNPQGTHGITSRNSTFDTSAVNAVPIYTGSSGGSYLFTNCYFSSGTAYSIQGGGGDPVTLENCDCSSNSSDTFALFFGGIVLNINNVSFTGTATDVSNSGIAIIPIPTTNDWAENSGTFLGTINIDYLFIGASTITLPAAPIQGTSFRCVVDTAAAIVITANTGQSIRFGSAISSVAGTLTNGAIGDAVELVYRSTGLVWITRNAVGTWLLA